MLRSTVSFVAGVAAALSAVSISQQSPGLEADAAQPRSWLSPLLLLQQPASDPAADSGATPAHHALGAIGRFGLPQVFARDEGPNLDLASNVAFPPLPPSAAKQASGLPPLQIMKYGFPDMGGIKYRDGYVLSYDRRNKTANWVCEHLSAERLAVQVARRENSNFKEDESDPEIFRAKLNDYRGSGYDRGHLAPAGNNKWGEKAMEDTFYLSNMSPQVGKGFNRDKWSELESFVRDLTKSNKNVYVCTGPLYIPRKEADGNLYIHYKVIGPSQVAVPTHFFKVAVCETATGQITIQSWILPNEPIPDTTSLSAFKVPLIEVEKRAGFLMYNNIDKKYSKVV